MADNCPKYLEDRFEYKFKNCKNDLILKLAGGAALGLLGKYLLTERKRWPIFIALGCAVGMASENCKRELNLTLTSCHKK
ncbi:MICOS complex subunit Mic10-like [Rhodnius prolixus]|uniref:MICOS complex subunit MIC10 n=1 Tax=Rhodnius prolixus TaxID=13249 RepID=A0A4P6D9X0_RHOPR